MAQRERIYLDNAATSWPKPPTVAESVERYLRENGASAGRGVYSHSQQVTQIINATRRRVAMLLGVREPRRIIFTFNGTDSTNLALHGCLRSGDHVITSEAEHNSVLRPLRFLEQHVGVEVTHVPVDETGLISPDDVRQAIRPNTRAIAILHASNVTGVLQPLQDIASVARDHDLLTIIDAAQTAGHLAIDAEHWGLDLVASSGHKGLLGPLGTGILYVGPRAEACVRPLRQGGTGSESESDEQPHSLPQRLESGNLNVVGLVGLERSTAYIQERDPAELRLHEQRLTARLLDGLRTIGAVQIYGPRNAEQQVGVVSIRAKGYDPQELATILDAEFAIQVRSGLHCAPRMHRRLGTLELGGTVRLSVGSFTEEPQVDAAVEGLAELLAGSA